MRQKGWRLIKGNRPRTYAEWGHSMEETPINNDVMLDRRFHASTFVIYMRMASLDWYDRVELRLKESRPQSVVELARLEGHTRQTLHRHLRILVATGWAEKVSPGHYRPLQVCPEIPRQRKTGVG